MNILPSSVGYRDPQNIFLINRAAKDKKRKRIEKNNYLRKHGRTAIQVKKKRKKNQTGQKKRTTTTGWTGGETREDGKKS